MPFAPKDKNAYNDSQGEKTMSTKKRRVGFANTATKAASTKDEAIRRPDANLPPSAEQINDATDDILHLIRQLDNFNANLRALDRKRANGVGIKRLGFVEAALRTAENFPQYYPHWLTTEKFQRDLGLFNAVRSLVEVCRSLEEKAWNISVEASDMVYTDALEYYSQVKDAARRRVDSAESIYAELHDFFRRGSVENGQPSEKKIKRDVDALLHGRKDGEIIIKNVRPKASGGKHEVIDETYKNTASFKKTDEGLISE
jgi:hypothetical protein